MSKTFRPWDVDQVWLLPPSIQDLVPSGHVAHFVRDTVRTGLDLSRIMDVYDEDRGFPPYHPGMMVALLLYAYSQGVYSSRRIGRGCEERLDFAAVTGMQHPDFRTDGGCLLGGEWTNGRQQDGGGGNEFMEHDQWWLAYE